jgi:hypothetical protein
MDDDDPFYTHDQFGRPLDPDSIARRQFLKELKHMSVDEFKALLIRIGMCKPDGTFIDEYLSTEPSAHRPTD